MLIYWIRFVNVSKPFRLYFELSRFDFVVDANLNVYLMEANMSSNLSTGHFIQNRLLYEQVISNILSLIRLTNRVDSEFSEEVETVHRSFEVTEVGSSDFRIPHFRWIQG